MPSAIGRARIRLVVLLMMLAIAAPAGLAAARYPEYWKWIALEETPMTWLQTVLLIVAAAGCGVIAVIGSVREWRFTARFPYLALALGFTYLALDDRFALHERLRDRIFAPRDIRIPGLTWLAPGDFQMLLTAVAGLCVLPFVLRALRTDRLALVLFGLGALIAAVSIGMDSIDPSTMPLDVERLEQTAEECLELLADCFFVAAVGVRLLGLLAEASWPESRTPTIEKAGAPDTAIPAPERRPAEPAFPTEERTALASEAIDAYAAHR